MATVSVTHMALAVGIFGLLVIWILKRNSVNLPPGPMSLLFFGNLRELNDHHHHPSIGYSPQNQKAKQNENKTISFTAGIGLADKATEWKDKYGPVFTMYLGPKPTVVISSIEAMTEAYVNSGDDFANKPHIVSLDVVSDNGKDIAFAQISGGVKFRRKTIIQSLRQYLTGSQHAERIHYIVEAAVNNIGQEKGPFDLEKHIFHIVLNVLHVLSFGRILDVDDKDFQTLHRLISNGSGNITNNWEDVFPFLRHFPTKKFRKFLSGNGEFVAYIKKELDKHRANLNETDVSSLADDILLTQRKLAQEKNTTLQVGSVLYSSQSIFSISSSLSRDIYSQAAITDSHVIVMLSDVFFAGVDTSRHTLGWIFLFLALNPDVQKKVQAEIDDIVGEVKRYTSPPQSHLKKKTVPRREHRAGLSYTEAVIHEIERLFPVVPVGLPHETLRDTQLMGYDIPAKTGIMVNHYAILRDPNHWDQPDSFVPERYLDKEGGKFSLKQKCWILFSIGQRSCVGK
ncbi:steroid 17-alpha-hydroxylase/17,20 lyase [Aplysia californica]|uniref:Steroid 17-alpha-hydroxylase/17,20 lyase n=1 Tax=Aplysia californica TaxID=6500 RepID=A0ABM1VPR3_APLCA|nr:steroid 17-alpha-hydroxylase/17,20 lyase [Aplysia californica]